MNQSEKKEKKNLYSKNIKVCKKKKKRGKGNRSIILWNEKSKALERSYKIPVETRFCYESIACVIEISNDVRSGITLTMGKYFEFSVESPSVTGRGSRSL